MSRKYLQIIFCLALCTVSFGSWNFLKFSNFWEGLIFFISISCNYFFIHSWLLLTAKRENPGTNTKVRYFYSSKNSLFFNNFSHQKQLGPPKISVFCEGETCKDHVPIEVTSESSIVTEEGTVEITETRSGQTCEPSDIVECPKVDCPFRAEITCPEIPEIKCPTIKLADFKCPDIPRVRCPKYAEMQCPKFQDFDCPTVPEVKCPTLDLQAITSIACPVIPPGWFEYCN